MEKKSMVALNEDIVRAVLKKEITPTSTQNMPFDKLTFSKARSGYGFSLECGKDKFLSVRSGERLMVYITNSGSAEYKKNFVISDIKADRLPNESAVESYKKYCINTIHTIIKEFLSTPADQKPNLGDETLYKF